MKITIQVKKPNNLFIVFLLFFKTISAQTYTQKINYGDIINIFYSQYEILRTHDTIHVLVKNDSIFSYEKKLKKPVVIFDEKYVVNEKYKSNITYLMYDIVKKHKNKIVIEVYTGTPYETDFGALTFSVSFHENTKLHIKKLKNKWVIVKVIFSDGTIKKRKWIENFLKQKDNYY